jgi:hypothetical protein
MPRFSVGFGRRKSTADNLNDAIAEPSFRVLDRTEVVGKSFDGGARLSAKTHHMPTTSVDINVEDNIFAEMKANRYDHSLLLHDTVTLDPSGGQWPSRCVVQAWGHWSCHVSTFHTPTMLCVLVRND